LISSDNKQKYLKWLSKAGNAAIIIVTALLAGFIAYIMVCSARGKAVDCFGRCVLKVVTGSMEPSLHTGDYIYVKKTDAADLKVGDIISFYSEEDDVRGKIVTHRIAEINSDGTFTTKGDANKTADVKHVRADQLVGKYTAKARFFKWLNSFGDRRKLLMIFVIIPMTLIALYEVKTIAKIKLEDRVPEPMSDEEKEKLIREAIDREKARLAEEHYEPGIEVEAVESGKDNEEENG
jgi:signal peptidase I